LKEFQTKRTETEKARDAEAEVTGGLRNWWMEDDLNCCYYYYYYTVHLHSPSNNKTSSLMRWMRILTEQ